MVLTEERLIEAKETLKELLECRLRTGQNKYQSKLLAFVSPADQREFSLYLRELTNLRDVIDLLDVKTGMFIDEII